MRGFFRRMSRGMDYSDALSTLTGSAPLDPATALTWLRRTNCREAGGAVGADRGWWSLTAHERAVLECVVLRSNEHGVCIATRDDMEVAGCPKKAQPVAIARLEAAGFFRVTGARRRRLFVLAPEPPAAYARPEDWSPAMLHKSLRPRDGQSAPPAPRVATPARTVSRADLLARVQASPFAPEIIATVKLATQALEVDRLSAEHVLPILEAVEHAVGPSPDERTWGRVRRAFATTNLRTDEQGLPLAASPRRWAGYFATVADAARMSGAERAAAALTRADAENAWEDAVAEAAAPVDTPSSPQEATDGPSPQVAPRPPQKAVTTAPVARTESGARVWDAASLAAAAIASGD